MSNQRPKQNSYTNHYTMIVYNKQTNHVMHYLAVVCVDKTLSQCVSDAALEKVYVVGLLF